MEQTANQVFDVEICLAVRLDIHQWVGDEIIEEFGGIF